MELNGFDREAFSKLIAEVKAKCDRESIKNTGAYVIFSMTLLTPIRMYCN